MKREIVVTADGSKTIRLVDLDENYHSSHGALQEAKHVFIKHGLSATVSTQPVRILEIGFGTGLNTYLSAEYSHTENIHVEYHGLEAFPVSSEEIELLEYEKLLEKSSVPWLTQIHALKWEVLGEVHERFSLKKINQKIEEVVFEAEFFEVIYYDAFGPRVQGEMWSPSIFQKMFDCLKVGGFLVTYCAKGQVKRDLKSIGFEVEALPGPPGKREMTRAWKR
jgi:tRNA U34 5-methylaminomethyl-2-thiouridine-forming methyltransferase MnmC